MREPLSTDARTAIDQSFTLRETINSNFNKIRALGDGILLEFGPQREQHVALRNSIRQSQAQLRMLFIARTALWKYRMRLPAFELPEAVALAQSEFDEEVANSLDAIADRFEGKSTVSRESSLENCFNRLEQLAQMPRLRESRAAQLETFLSLSRRVEEIALSLSQYTLNDWSLRRFEQPVHGGAHSRSLQLSVQPGSPENPILRG